MELDEGEDQVGESKQAKERGGLAIVWISMISIFDHKLVCTVMTAFRIHNWILGMDS